MRLNIPWFIWTFCDLRAKLSAKLCFLARRHKSLEKRGKWARKLKKRSALPCDVSRDGGRCANPFSRLKSTLSIYAHFTAYARTFGISPPLPCDFACMGEYTSSIFHCSVYILLRLRRTAIPTSSEMVDDRVVWYATVCGVPKDMT